MYVSPEMPGDNCAMSTPILHHFGIRSTALLGKGSESQVYALDQARVLRIYPPGASLAAIQARQDFCRQLAARHPPFVIPTVLDQGVSDEQPYTVEQRMHGHDFAYVLPQLTGRDRKRALSSYIDLATQIGTIQFPDAPFGEIILPGTLQRDTWPEFLWDRAQQTLRISRRDVEHDVPQLDRLLSEFHTHLLPTATIQTKCLVH
jgi:Ser/Thr protein kinase RdoA (MazF antagonist)